MDKAVEKYIKKQKSPQKEICQKIREIILKTFPKIGEGTRMGVPWYGGRYYVVALKDHVNLGFCMGGLSRKDMDLFEGKGKFMRHIKIFTPEEKKMIKLLKIIKKKYKPSC